MVLIDAVFINNSGGKILLDYLIKSIETKGIKVSYLLDARVKNNHPSILTNSVTYLSPTLMERHRFYLENKKKIRTVLCFGNLPPTIRLQASVFTYFHQPLFIEASKNNTVKEKIIIRIKTLILNYLKGNTNKWLVQSQNIRLGLINKYNISGSSVMILPFYPKISTSKKIARIRNRFVYVSGNASHKNQLRLLNGFIKFYDSFKIGELHLTISSENDKFCEQLKYLKSKGYPIINYGFVDQSFLVDLYRSCEYSIYPSLTESFGLGLIEALENNCKIIGADRPYTFAVCKPSLSFDPESEDAIAEAFRVAVFEDLPKSEQLVFDQIDDILKLLTINKGYY